MSRVVDMRCGVREWAVEREWGVHEVERFRHGYGGRRPWWHVSLLHLVLVLPPPHFGHPLQVLFLLVPVLLPTPRIFTLILCDPYFVHREVPAAPFDITRTCFD